MSNPKPTQAQVKQIRKERTKARKAGDLKTYGLMNQWLYAYVDGPHAAR